jgi:hypothetical protein
METGDKRSEKLLDNSLLISEAYRLEQERLHAVGNYGVMGEHYAPMVDKIITGMGVFHLLDYGCGSRLSLGKALKTGRKLTYQAYDPGVPAYSAAPVPAEMVACIDVLEHIEPDCLLAVLDDLKRLTLGVLFATIATGPAAKTLSDGRNAHLIQKPIWWWFPKLVDRWELQSLVRDEHGFIFIGFAKSQLEGANGELLG